MYIIRKRIQRFVAAHKSSELSAAWDPSTVIMTLMNLQLVSQCEWGRYVRLLAAAVVVDIYKYNS